MIIYHTVARIYPQYYFIDSIENTFHWWSQGVAPSPPSPASSTNSRAPFISNMGRLMTRGGF